MKSSSLFLAAGLLAVLPLSAQAKITRNVEKSFAVQPGGTFRAETSGGDIVVNPGPSDQVRIVARQTVRAKTEAEADEILAKLELTLEQQGNDVVAKAKYPGKSGFSMTGIWPPVTVSFEVTVPEKFNLELRTSGGDIVSGNLQGKVTAHTSGGDVTLGRIDGEVQAHTSGGDIGLGGSTSAVKLHTSGGDIEVGSVAASVDASTSGGDIKARFEGGPKSDCSFRTSGGDVDVEVGAAAAFRLDASTSGGDVKIRNVTVAVESGGHGKSKLVGAVNGGGPLLKLRTSGGDIGVRAQSANR
jgi:hypothetical protein